MKHKHRIIPGYEDGEYTEVNTVELTPTQHAMWHFAEWKRKGDWRDEKAWRGLAGLLSKEELIQQILSEAGKKGGSKPKTALQRKDLWEKAEELKVEYENGAKIKEMKEKYLCGQGTILEILKSVGTKMRKRGDGADKSYLRGNTHSKGKFWWTNGLIEKSSKTCPGAGWIRGRLKYKEAHATIQT